MKLKVINRQITDKMLLPERYWHRAKPIPFINLFVSLNELSSVRLFEEGMHFLSQRGIELISFSVLKIEDHET